MSKTIKTPVDKGEVLFALLALDGADHHAAANLTRRMWSEIETHRADLSAAAGELLVPLPEPGSVTAKLLRANVLMRWALAESSTRVCFIVAVGCDVQLGIVRSETLGWCATLDAARSLVLGWECDWTEAGYYSHLLMFDPGTSEVAWYRSVLPEGWVFGYGSPPVPITPCDAPEWWNVGNPGETYLVNVLGEIETRTQLRAALERAEANNSALAARLRDAQTTALTLALVRAELARTERDTLTATDALHARCDAAERERDALRGALMRLVTAEDAYQAATVDEDDNGVRAFVALDEAWAHALDVLARTGGDR